MCPPALMARLCVALLCLSPLHFAFAATTPGDTDLIRDRQNRLLQEQRQRLEELKALPGSPSTPDEPAMPADSRCFAIDTIDIEGAGQTRLVLRDNSGNEFDAAIP